MTRTVPESLKTYEAFRGLYARVAEQLGLDSSYVSRVANGQRRNEPALRAIEAELIRIHRASRRAEAKSSAKKKTITPPLKHQKAACRLNLTARLRLLRLTATARNELQQAESDSERLLCLSAPPDRWLFSNWPAAKVFTHQPRGRFRLMQCRAAAAPRSGIRTGRASSLYRDRARKARKPFTSLPPCIEPERAKNTARSTARSAALTE